MKQQWTTAQAWDRADHVLKFTLTKEITSDVEDLIATRRATVIAIWSYGI